MLLKLQFENNVCTMGFYDVQYTTLMFLFTNFTCKYCFQCAVCVLYIPYRLYLFILCQWMLFVYRFHKTTGTTVSLLLHLVLFHLGHFFFAPMLDIYHQHQCCINELQGKPSFIPTNSEYLS